MTYHVLREKGHGAFAIVEVVCDDKGKQFAQKTYKPSEQTTKNIKAQELKKRFIREVKCQQSLHHPNIVPVVDEFLQDDPPRFIMPLASHTLRDELYDATINNKTFKTEQLNKILFDILAGLEFLHNEGFIHRDLKPANILRFNTHDKDEDYYYALSDFGLVSALDKDTSTLTATNAGGGTENYSAPELVRSFRSATAQSDIYSFGAILHDIFGKIPRVPYTELTLANPVGSVIAKCTKTQPKRRYANVSELREELYQVLRTHDIHFTSSNEEVAVKLLQDSDILTDEDWDVVFMQLDDNIDKEHDIDNIIAVLSLNHIDNLQENSPELFHAMGEYLAEHIMAETFDFEYCDVIANKAERFYQSANLGLQAIITLALLEMGTSHNRFYVERKVKNMLSDSISNELARRIALESSLQSYDFADKIAHLCQSIDVDDDFLHEELRNLL